MPKPSKSAPLAVGNRVQLTHQGRAVSGVVARIGTRGAFILCDDRQWLQVPLAALDSAQAPLSGKAPAAPLMPAATSEVPVFRVSESVAFDFRGRPVEGRITRLNPKRALVLGEDGREFQVPYSRLSRPAGANEVLPTQDDPLAAVTDQAQELLRQHGLPDWRFRFDHGSRRAGCCRFDRREISLARQFALVAPAEEILDTLLHEIAHALVGKKHNHDAVWRAKAMAIGGTGRRCHSLRFAPPRYIVFCTRGCWIATAERRRRNVICRRCHGDIHYQTYTEERWRQLKPDGPQTPS